MLMQPTVVTMMCLQRRDLSTQHIYGGYKINNFCDLYSQHRGIAEGTFRYEECVLEMCEVICDPNDNNDNNSVIDNGEKSERHMLEIYLLSTIKINVQTENKT